MRPLLAALLVAALAPGALAQDPTASRFELEPVPAPVMPLMGGVERNWTADLFCQPPLPAQPAPELRVWVASRPPWATVLVEPETTELFCDATRAQASGIVKVSVGPNAPAGATAPLELAASWTDAQGNRTLLAATDLTAGSFLILDVSVAEAIAVARPGASREFPVRVTNLGNGPARVAFEVVRASEGLAVDPIEPFVLDSRQHGGATVSRELPIVVRTADGFGYQNEVGTVDLRVRSESTLDGTQGDESAVSLLLTTRGLSTPAPPAALVLAAVAALAASRIRS